jgi:hypothetical protein
MQNLHNSSKEQVRKKPIHNAKENKAQQDLDQIEYPIVHLDLNL